MTPSHAPTRMDRHDNKRRRLSGTFGLRSGWFLRTVKIHGLLICMLLMPLQLFAAVTFDGETIQTNRSQTSVMSLTISDKTTAGSNRYGIVALMTGSDTVTGVTWGGSAMTLLGKNTNPTDGRTAHLYGISNPPTAASNVVVSLGGGGTKITAVVSSFSGVHQSTPYGTAQTANGTTSPATVNVTDAVTGDMVVDSLYFYGSNVPPSVGADQTELGHTDDGARWGSSSYEAGAATVTMSWTLTSPTRWSTVAVALKTASVATTYVATHCVETYDQVSGASNDYADLGATSWANSAAVDGVCSTYTTLGTAMFNAEAGDNVKVHTGVYSGFAETSSRKPSFYPHNDGTLGNEIVFFAEVPAATSQSSPALWTELRISDPYPITNLPPDPIGKPVLGSTTSYGGDHVIFDGFAARYPYVPPYPSQGAFAGGAEYVQFRRIYYDYGDMPDLTLGDQFNAIFFQYGTHFKLQDSYFTGNYGQTEDGLLGGKNYAAVTVYDSDNFEITNNTFFNIHTGLFIKANASVSSSEHNSGEIAYNRFETSSYTGLIIYEVQSGQTVNAHHNLFIDAGFEDFTAGGILGHNFNFYNNTLVGGSTTGAGGAQVSMLYFKNNASVPASPSPAYALYNNIFIIDDARTTYMVAGEESFDTHFADYTTFGYNIYDDKTGTPVYYDGSNLSFTGYTAETGETGSSESTVTLDSSHCLVANGQAALTASNVAGPIGFCVTGTEVVGVRANPTY